MITATSVPILPSPVQSLRHNQAMKVLWRRKDGPSNFSYLAPILSSWASAPRSSVLIVKGSLSTRRDTTGLVTDIFDLIKSAGIPVVWALKGSSDIQPENDMKIQILKYLVMQVLQLNSALLNKISAGFNAAVLQSATTEEDWFKVLHTVTSGLSELYIVIDAELLQLGTEEKHWSTDFLQMLRGFIRGTGNTIIKVIIFSYRQFPEQATFSTAKDIVLAEIKKPQPVRKRQMTFYSPRGAVRMATKGGRGGSAMYLARSIPMRQRAQS